MNDTSHKEAYVRDVLIPGMVERGDLSFTECVPEGGRVQLRSVDVRPLVTNGFMLTIPFVVTAVLEQTPVVGADIKTETVHLIVKVGGKLLLRDAKFAQNVKHKRVILNC
uniref:Uncharacterized protein n=1 Tax=Anopheles culicifacies TaxID=139723 RepID=A0A182LUT9_9DIPT